MSYLLANAWKHCRLEFKKILNIHYITHEIYTFIIGEVKLAFSLRLPLVMMAANVFSSLLNSHFFLMELKFHMNVFNRWTGHTCWAALTGGDRSSDRHVSPCWSLRSSRKSSEGEGPWSFSYRIFKIHAQRLEHDSCVVLWHLVFSPVPPSQPVYISDCNLEWMRMTLHALILPPIDIIFSSLTQIFFNVL